MAYNQVNDAADPYANNTTGSQPSLSTRSVNSSANLLEAKKTRPQWRDYPLSVSFIFANVFFERFAFSGMRAILIFYMTGIMQLDDNTAVALIGAFFVVVFSSAVFGGVLADGYIGKFHTILWVSIVYAVGNTVLAVAATEETASIHPWLDLLAIAVIALSCGMERPCVPAFGGDQFSQDQAKSLDKFFSIFYFVVNLGGTVAGYIGPMLRVMDCQGKSTCYPLAFGIPAILMALSCISFFLGAWWYKKPPPKNNVLVAVLKTMSHALHNKRKFFVKRDHWLEHYMDDHECEKDPECKLRGTCQKAQFVTDIKAVLRLLVMYVPLPIFWALYDQQSSRWTIQGAFMDGHLGGYTLLPDQIGTANPVLIVLLIPVFSWGIYPLCGKIFRVTPLRKMTAGGILAVVSFIICAFLQLAVNKTLPPVPSSSQTRLEFSNYAPCSVSIHLKGDNYDNTTTIPSLGNVTYDNLPAVNYHYTIQDLCVGGNTSENFSPTGGKAYYGIVASVFDVHTNTSVLKARTGESTLDKSLNGDGSFILNTNFFLPDLAHTNYNYYNVNICSMPDQNRSYSACITNHNEDYDLFMATVDNTTYATDWQTIVPGTTWHIWVVLDDTPYHYGAFKFDEQGAIYTLTLFGANSTQDILDGKGQFEFYYIAQANSINIMWQIPQYFVITCAEILFSITGLEFSYSQAPASMKSVMQAIWLLAVAVGNVIVIVIAATQIFSNRAYEFFLYAAFMAVVMVIFAALCQWYYEYVYYEAESEDESTAKSEKS